MSTPTTASKPASKSGSPHGDCWVGFDLGGTKMLAEVLDSTFRPLARKRKKTKGYEGVRAGIGRITQAIQTTLDEAEIPRERLQGIGVGCPGPLDLDRGIMLDAPNLGWREVPIKDLLETEFGCPVVIANDVDVGVYGENRFGAAQKSRCVLGVFPGTGIGGGCVYEGKILRGAKSSCLEIGHVQVISGGPRCGCGLYGCLEAVASRLAIAGAAAQAAYRGQAPHLQEMVGTDPAKIRSGILAASVEAGDTVVEEIIRHAARQIGTVIGGVVHLLSPDTIVMGGGLVEAMPKLFVDEVGRSARKHVMPSFKESFRVVAAKLGDDATALGAAAWAREVIVARG